MRGEIPPELPRGGLIIARVAAGTNPGVTAGLSGETLIAADQKGRRLNNREDRPSKAHDDDDSRPTSTQRIVKPFKRID
jgi:hypothetical protein